MTRSVLVIAGEVSGDLHAAGVVRALRAADPGVAVWGVGGDALREAGAELLYHVRDMAVMGLPEVLRKYGFFRRAFGHLVRELRARRPGLVLLVDYPGFNLRFARAAHDAGFRVVYFVCPQVWAWHRSRIPRMARTIDRLLVLFPFERAVFEGTGLRVDFVGHPLVDTCRTALAEPLAELPWAGEPRVAMLPGSRRQEVERVLPALCAAARVLRRASPQASFLIAAPSPSVAALAQAVATREGARWPVIAGRTPQVLRQAAAAWVCSGTATLEAALLGCPMAVVYRTAPLTYALARRLVRVPHIGMVNLIAGRELCPELIQGGATPERLAAALSPLLGDPAARAAMLAGYAEVAARLGPGDASRRAAAIVLEELRSARS